jgi:hypothetical protein
MGGSMGGVHGGAPHTPAKEGGGGDGCEELAALGAGGDDAVDAVRLTLRVHVRHAHPERRHEEGRERAEEDRKGKGERERLPCEHGKLECEEREAHREDAVEHWLHRAERQPIAHQCVQWVAHEHQPEACDRHQRRRLNACLKRHGV